jgi:hypothetical protein
MVTNKVASSGVKRLVWKLVMNILDELLFHLQLTLKMKVTGSTKLCHTLGDGSLQD